MGITKQYLRVVPAGRCGLIGSVNSNLVQIDGRVCAVAACENVLFWDVRREENVCVLHGGGQSCVSTIAYEPVSCWTCVGYEDGTIRLFHPADADSGAKIVLSGHRSGVSVLRVDPERLMLASGGKDSQIILWDIVNEAGLVKLSGHKAPITNLQFLSQRQLIVSSSKDSLIKFWDIKAQHCVYTLIGHRTEVWDFLLLADGTKLITGSAEAELKVYTVGYMDGTREEKDEPVENVGKRAMMEEPDEQDGGLASTSDQECNVLTCSYEGSLIRNGKGRVQQLKLSRDGRIMLSLSTGHGIDAWRIQDESEMAKAVQKKLRKLRKKAEKDGGSSSVAIVSAQDDNAMLAELPTNERLKMQFIALGEQRFQAKVKSVDFVPCSPSSDYQIALLLNNNQIQQHRLSPDPGSNSWTTDLVATVGSTKGHRSDVRAVCFSSENSSILTGSSESVKVWNRISLACIRTIPCVEVLSAMFVPGDRHCVLGCKNGQLSLVDITASNVMETHEDAHQGPLWTMDSFHDDRGIATGSGDKSVKFWNYELVSVDDAKRLSLVHTRTLEMKEDVLCLKFSKNGKFLAAGLLDNTIKLFFVDTLKFFLSMYGHSLPVLCLDISDDSRLLVSGAADKNVKIWGMDFGDCHRSLFAHDDSVTCVRFVPKTHLFLSCGKDGKIRQWDADNFEKILTLDGHHGEVWCLAVSPSGLYSVSAGHDKSIRVWEKSSEPLVLEEEQEMEREQEYEKTLEQEEDVVPGETEGEIGIASKKTIDSVKSTESVISAMDICREETELGKEDKHNKNPPLKHPLIVAYKSASLECFVLDVLRRIRSSHLEKCLMLVPFSYSLELLGYLADAIGAGYEVELACRCLFFLVKIHHGQLVNCSAALPIMDRVRGVTKAKVADLRDTIGFNIAAMKFMQLDLKEKQDVQLFLDATVKRKEKRKSKKKTEEASAFVLTM